jgi:hypothetical protein
MRMFLLKPLMTALFTEASAGEDAEALGLTHKGWGRYYDADGNLAAKSINGKLVKVDPNDDENHDDDYRDAEDQLNADPDSPQKMATATAAFASSHHKDDPQQVQKLQRMQKLAKILRKMKDNGADWDHLSPQAQKSLQRISKQLAKDKEFKAGYPKNNDIGMNKSLDWEKEERKARSMTSDQLAYAIKDAMAARDASKGWNANGEGYYADMAMTYAKELKARRDGLAQEPAPTTPSLKDLMPKDALPVDNNTKTAIDKLIGNADDKMMNMLEPLFIKHKETRPEFSPAYDYALDLIKQKRGSSESPNPMKDKEVDGHQLDAFKRAPESDDTDNPFDKSKSTPRFKDLAPDKYDDPEAERQSKEDDDYHNNPSRFGPDR